MLEYSECANNYDIFLCGDFNARTSTLPDIITDECTAFNGGQPNFACSNILADSQRYNMDIKANTYGNLLIELVKIQVLLLQMVEFTRINTEAPLHTTIEMLKV